MFDKTRPMELGDIFSTTFNLFRETFTRNIIIAAVFLIPAGILFACGLQSYFTAIATAFDLARGDAQNMNRETVNMIAHAGIFFLSLFIFLLAYLAAYIGITKTACSSIDGNRLSLGEIFRNVFSITYLRSIGIILVYVMVVAGLISIVVIISRIGDNLLIKFFEVILIFALYLFMIFLIIRWFFTFIFLIHENEQITESLGRSYSLVRGYWWRTFGIIILISIAVSFAVTIVTTPISFLFMWDFIRQYYTLAAGGDLKDNPEALFKLMRSMGFAFGLNIILSTLFQTIIMPLFQVVMYFDLRIRKNDFKTETVPENENDLLNRVLDGE